MFLFDTRHGGLPYLLLDLVALVSIAATSKVLVHNGYYSLLFAPAACDAAAGKECPLFQVGDQVEVHDTPLVHPFVATVSHVSYDAQGAIQYDVRSMLDDRPFRDVPSSSVWPKEGWKFDTPGLCDLGDALGERLGRCTVLSRHSEDMYLVSLLVDGFLCYHQLPSSRLRRIENATVLDQIPPNVTQHGYDDEEAPHLKLGTLVEMTTRDERFAYPAKIVSYVKEGVAGGAATYDLEHAITGARIPNVAPEFVLPYQVLAYGTQAFCNVATGMDERRRKRVEMAPCTVLSSTKERDGFAYRVSYLDRDSVWVQETMPHSRIQRILTLNRQR